MEEPIGKLPNPLEKTNNSKPSTENLVSRKRKNDEVEPEITPEKPAQELKRTKKLKWEKFVGRRAEGSVEHATYFTPDECKTYFEELQDQIEYLNPEETCVSVYGKKYNLPHDKALYGDKGLEYKQAKRSPIACSDWCPVLLKLKAQMEALQNCKFNMCILNKFDDGENSMGVFAHDEEDVDQSVPIVSISFGGRRDYKFKPNNNKEDTFNIPIKDGTVVVMHDPMQRNWKHAVPKRKKEKSQTLTMIFRSVIVEDEEDQNQDPSDS